MDLEVQTRATIQELHEQLGLRAVLFYMRGAEEIFGIACQQGAEIAWRGIVADEHLRQSRSRRTSGIARRGRRVGWVDRPGGRRNPVFGKMGIGGGRHLRELIE